MKFLFCHRNFPAQFRHIIQFLSQEGNHEIVFLTGTENDRQMQGVKKYCYKLKREVPEDCHQYLRSYEQSIIHAQAAAEVLISLKQRGFYPDVIYAHSWGNSMYFKDIYPDVPLINYCEWYYNASNSDVDFMKKDISIDQRARVRSMNAPILLDLISCDKGICPTNFQKLQFPKIFHDKIEVLHDGINTDLFTKDDNVEFKVPNSDVVLTRKDEVITYATRGMEEYRGFVQLMQMVEKLLKRRPNVKVVIGGEDRVCYGAKLKGTTYKKYMLEHLDLDLSRVYFTGGLPYGEYRKLLQVSKVHTYLTYPFVLSWSFLEAMSCGCLICASNTAPIQEFMEDNYNGLLFDFKNVDEFLNRVEYALDNYDKLQNIRENARKTIVEGYDLKLELPKILNILYEYGNKKKNTVKDV